MTYANKAYVLQNGEEFILKFFQTRPKFNDSLDGALKPEDIKVESVDVGEIVMSPVVELQASN